MYMYMSVCVNDNTIISMIIGLIIYIMHMVKSGNIKIRMNSQARSQPVGSAWIHINTVQLHQIPLSFFCSPHRFPWFARHFQP